MVLVKICGLKDLKSAEVAVQNKSDLIGMILVPNRDRTVDTDEAISIVNMIKGTRRAKRSRDLKEFLEETTPSKSEILEFIHENGPFSVGVFRNQSIEDIKTLQSIIGFDIVQLHGSEDRLRYLEELDIPVIVRYTPNDRDLSKFHEFGHLLPLFDSEAGGEGKKLNWEKLDQDVYHGRGVEYVLAGGLTPSNVSEAVKGAGVLGVDVSGGVETEGVKDHSKIIDFIKNAKSATK